MKKNYEVQVLILRVESIHTRGKLRTGMKTLASVATLTDGNHP